MSPRPEFRHVANGQLTLVLHHLRRLIRKQGAGELADSRLLERFVQDKDEAAFEVLVWRHGPMVLSLCQRILHNVHDAEDVLQATFLTLVRRASSIGKREALASWLYKVAYRIALRAKARAAKTAALPRPIEEVADPASTEQAAWHELRPVLDEALGHLPEKYRTPIVLCYLQGRTNREAADLLGCPIGTVSTRLTRGREMLRRQLSRRGVTLSAGLLATVLGQHAVSAAVAGPLVVSTIRAAALVAAGQSGTAGVIAAGVAELVEGASQPMSITPFKMCLALVVTAGLVAGVAVGRRDAPPPEAGPIAAADPPRPHAAPEQAVEKVVITGRVLDPVGKPVSGARIYWPNIPKEMPKSEDEIAFSQRAVTDSDGRFRLELPRSDLRPDWRIPLVAAAEGFGVAGEVPPKDAASADLTLRLVKDQPIHGRLLNSEGKPLAGVSVTAAAVSTPPTGGLDAFLTAWKREWQMAPQQLQPLYLPGKSALATTTDREGRFEMKGAGAERVVQFRVKGPGVAQGQLWVVTRPGFDAAPYNKAAVERMPPALRLPGQPPLLYGPTFDFVAVATRVIEGVVREAATGKPVAGVSIWSSFGYDNGVKAVSDAQGRYRLSGLPKMKEYTVYTETNAKSPWLRRSVRIPDAEGLQPLSVDLDLVRGVTLTGRVIDRSTGKGVKSGVRFVPLPDNKYFGKPGYDSYRYERLMNSTDAEGRFKTAVIPGPGVVMAQAYGSGEMIAGQPVKPYKLAALNAADRKRVAVDGDGAFVAAGNSLEFLGIENACKVIDPAGDAGTVTCDLYVERGRELTVNILDPDGNPLAGAMVAGMTASPPFAFALTDAKCKVYALEPAKPRLVVFYHSQRKLAGKLSVRGDEETPPSVRLTAAGAVTGRLLDADGQPIAEADVGLSFPSGAASELYRQLDPQREPTRTDKDGGFCLEGIVPDLKFGLSLRAGNTFLVGEPRIGQKQVESGKTLDLGDVRTKAAQR